MANDSEVANKKDSIPGIDYDPGNKKGPASYSMIEPRLKNIYAQFYKETYYTDKKVLDAKTQELIALGCSLIAKCDGCIEGHITKALKEGATKEEISECIVIAVGINAAAIVDMTDKAAAKLKLNHFPAGLSRKT
ncbi:MAG: carboxymuconolactone decarboxylase family protein [Acidobacteria bacterium]|nr:MAG: carboxymuconolactone decarboxylase family protein [Acidobacteriota bacterium]